MRPPRFKLRTVVAIVTLATLAVVGFEYSRRSARYRSIAVQELLMEKTDRASAQSARMEWERFHEAAAHGVFLGPPILDFNDIRAIEVRADLHARRRAAFVRCARYPWLPVPPDAPPPD